MITLSRSSPPARLLRSAWLLSASALLAAVTACSGADADGAPQLTDGPTTTTQALTTQPSTSPPPTPEEVATAAALATFDGYWQITQSYQQAPAARNWEPEIHKYADDTATAVDLSNLQVFLEDGIKQVGTQTVEPAVTSVDLAAEPGPTVALTVCFEPGDSRNVFVSTGERANREPAIPRWELLVTVIQYPQQEGAPWLVHSFEPRLETPC